MKRKPNVEGERSGATFGRLLPHLKRDGDNDICTLAFLRSRTGGHVGEAPGHDPHTSCSGRSSVFIALCSYREPWTEGQLMCSVCMKTNSEVVGFVFPRKQTNDLPGKP